MAPRRGDAEPETHRACRTPVRIVGGRWAGRTLTSPGGRVRPTAEDVRVRCMDLVGAELPDARVLDLFAGTGALGLEALSRGAASADFVESQAGALHALKANVAALGARSRARVFKKDAVPFLDGLEPGAYDVAFVDPPYASGLAARVAQRWIEVPFADVLVIEHATGVALPGGGRRSPIGDTCLTLLRVPGAAPRG